jgi:2-keto-3-deoxy-L-rhamnonate aldolase RhmA
VRFDPATTDNPLIRRLAVGETVLCMAIRISRLPHVVHIAHAAGFDAIYVDMEHSVISMEDASALCLAAWSIGIAPLVRVPSHDPHFIGRILEGGAVGIIAPHVDTPEEAAGIVAASCFPPLGHRALAGAGIVTGYGAMAPAEAAARLNDRTLVVVMLESERAIAHADAIAAVAGVDMLFIGAGDLMHDLGISGNPEHPKIIAAFERAATACRRHGIALGVAGIKGESPLMGQLHRLGARFLSTRNDEALLVKAANEEVKSMRRVFAS